MAGTYGAAGLNPYTIKGIGGILSNEVNAESGVTQVYRGGALTTQQSIGTYNPATGKFTPDANANLTSAEKSTLSSTSGTTAIKNAAIQTATKAGATNASQLLSPNTAKSTSAPDAQSGSTPTADTSKPQPTSSGGGAVFVYPIGMRATQQDRLKFTAVEYQPSGNLNTGTFSSPNRTSTQDKSIIGTVFLPIQAGISDFNSVNWQEGSLNEIEELALNTSLKAMNAKSPGDFGKAFETAAGTAAKDLLGKNENQLKVYLAQQALGTQNLLSRFGTVLNPNLELLFSGPQLRPFEFKFQMSAREKEEGENIKSIINFFKKNMAVKKSDGAGIFLKAPNTFLIEYKYNGADETHPGINLIKECALLSCSVEYTPLGTYMTYPDGTMVSYSMSLSFSELEPIYSTDYDGHPIGY